MKHRTIVAQIMATVAIGGMAVTPIVASAQSWRDDESHHRQQKKNEWRNIGIGAGALGLLGLVKHDNTLMFAGTAGALYSAYRYDQDRKSQSRTDRARAAYFSRDHFYRNGHRYTRKTVWRNGQKYYRFVRG